MPRSINKPSNLVNTSSSVVLRAIAFLAASWTGTFLSGIPTGFYDWDCYLTPIETLLGSLEPDTLRILLWGFLYMLDLPPLLFFLFYLGIPIVAYRIIFTDDPLFFWSMLMVTLTMLGGSLLEWKWSFLPALTFLLFLATYGLWFFLQWDHPGFLERMVIRIQRVIR